MLYQFPFALPKLQNAPWGNQERILKYLTYFNTSIIYLQLESNTINEILIHYVILYEIFKVDWYPIRKSQERI